MGEIKSTPTSPLFSAPEPIAAEHDVSQFSCGKSPLDDWLRQHAQKNEGRASRTFVVRTGSTVVAYYTLASGSVGHKHAPKPLVRNMPPDIPILVLGRLAVDRRYHGQRLGKFLLRDALRRALSVSTEVGVRAVVVHAIDREVVPFYESFGFKLFPEEKLTLFLSVSEIAAALDS